MPVFFTGLILVYVFYYLLGWAPAPLGRLDVFFDPPPQVTGFSTRTGDSADQEARQTFRKEGLFSPSTQVLLVDTPTATVATDANLLSIVDIADASLRP